MSRDIDYAKKMKETNQFIIDETNEKTGPVVRWVSNDRIPFEDMLQIFKDLGYIDEQTFSNSCETRLDEQAAFFAEYRKQMATHVPSDEERFEARAAHGEGVTLVNVITGQKGRT